MKKIVLMMSIGLSILFSNTQKIELTGKSLKELKNPFNFLREKKNTIGIFAKDKVVVLEVESNYNDFEKYNSQNGITEYSLNNKDVINIEKEFYSDEYKNILIGDKCNIEINILKGNVELIYNTENEINHLTSIKVKLEIKIFVNGVETIETLEMDHRLDIPKDYENTITANDFFILKEKETVETIIERIINKILLTKDIK